MLGDTYRVDYFFINEVPSKLFGTEFKIRLMSGYMFKKPEFLEDMNDKHNIRVARITRLILNEKYKKKHRIFQNMELVIMTKKQVLLKTTPEPCWLSYV